MALDSMESDEERKDLIKKRKQDNPQLYYAHNILQEIKSKKDSNFIFLTSNLVIAEVISVIHDKLCVDIMYKSGMPLKYWYKYRYDFNLSEEDMTNLMQEMTSFYEEFINKEKIILIGSLGLKYIFDIISKHKETHDSFLISQAIEEESKYFISKDTRLKRNLKDYKKISICNPKHFYTNILSNKNKEN